MNKEARMFYLIRRVQLASSNALQERLQSVGLTASQYTAMSMLGIGARSLRLRWRGSSTLRRNR